jgi:superfamily II DNA or RNA helicase
MPAYDLRALPVRGIRGGSLVLDAPASDARVKAITADLAKRLKLPKGTKAHRIVQRQVWLPRHGDHRVTVAADDTSYPAGRALRFARPLRSYQASAVEAVLRAGGGVLEAPCGSGKTVMGLAVLSRLQTRALVLAHTRDLIEQWRERAGEYLPGVRVAEAGDDDEAKADIVLATVQTLARWGVSKLVKWGKGFGAFVLDEAHHAPAKTFTHVVGAMAARWRIGLTATPKRADGLSPLLMAHFGPVAHRVSAAVLEQAGATVTPHVRFVRAGSTPGDGAFMQTLRRLVIAHAAEGRTILVLVRLVEEAHDLAAGLRSVGARALVGELSDASRKRALDDARRGSLRVLIATSLADEGLDVPQLDTLVMGTRTGISGRLKQRVGRIQRPHAGKKQPLVIDLVAADDDGVTERERTYRELGCAVAR